MELRQLRYFVTIARLENMTAAAESLHVAQPALSAQLAKLEHEWGTPLFERVGRGIRLTEAGRLLCEASEAVLDGADGLAGLADALRKGAAGHLRIGYVRSFPFRDLTALLRAFRTEHPAIALTLRETDTETQATLLRRGDLDASFLQLTPKLDGLDLRFHAVSAYEPMVVLPADHRLADAASIRLSDVAGDDWVLLSTEYDGGYRTRIENAFRNSNVQPKVRQEAADVRIVLGLVAAGLGVTMLLSSSRELQIAGVRYVPFAEPPPAFRFVMAVRNGAVRTGPLSLLERTVDEYALDREDATSA